MSEKHLFKNAIIFGLIYVFVIVVIAIPLYTVIKLAFLIFIYLGSGGEISSIWSTSLIEITETSLVSGLVTLVGCSISSVIFLVKKVSAVKSDFLLVSFLSYASITIVPGLYFLISDDGVVIFSGLVSSFVVFALFTKYMFRGNKFTPR